jgi:hypothetical protein
MSIPPQSPDGVVPPFSQSRADRVTVWRWWLHRLWFVHPGLDMFVALTPLACLRLLDKTSKPDVKRLELRDLFNNGRRYHVSPTETGFVVHTTTKVVWRYRGRTSPNTVVEGTILPQEGRILIRLTAHIKLTYILGFLLLPLFITSMVIYTPWHFLVKGVLILALFGLSWAGHRYDAALEAYEVMHYIQQVLKPHIPEEPLTLATGQDVVYDAARFAQAWESFYHTLQQDS